MNILLFERELRVFNTSPAQTKHLRDVLKAGVGDEIKCGVLNQFCFTGKVLEAGRREYTIEMGERHEAKPPSGVHLIVGASRPRMLQRILHLAGEFSVSRIWLVPTELSEKSYLQSSSYEPESIREHLVQGLEQGGNVFLPEARLFRRVLLREKEELRAVSLAQKYVLDGNEAGEQAADFSGELCLALGPERGWTVEELEFLQKAGFRRLKISERVLRLETAVAAVLGITDWQRQQGL